MKNVLGIPVSHNNRRVLRRATEDDYSVNLKELPSNRPCLWDLDRKLKVALRLALTAISQRQSCPYFSALVVIAKLIGAVFKLTGHKANYLDLLIFYEHSKYSTVSGFLFKFLKTCFLFSLLSNYSFRATPKNTSIVSPPPASRINISVEMAERPAFSYMNEALASSMASGCLASDLGQSE